MVRREPEVGQAQDEDLPQLSQDQQDRKTAAEARREQMIVDLKVEARLLCEMFRGHKPRLGDLFKMLDDPELWGEVTEVQDDGVVTISVKLPPEASDVYIEFNQVLALDD